MTSDERCQLRYWFDYDYCLWAANQAARDRFGYPIEPDDLPLSADTAARVEEVTRIYNDLLVGDEPGTHPWMKSESPWFYRMAEELLVRLRGELEPEFEIVGHLLPEGSALAAGG